MNGDCYFDDLDQQEVINQIPDRKDCVEAIFGEFNAIKGGKLF